MASPSPSPSPSPSSSSSITSLLLIFTLFTTLTNATLNLTVVNDCPFTVWPAIQPNAGHPVLERGGFELKTHNHKSFIAPQHWTGRIWARTFCSSQNGHFTCATGDCGASVYCEGRGGETPATLAQFNLHHGHNGELSSYAVSLVDGFNVPMTVTPHGGGGVCPVVGCKADLIKTCLPELQFKPAAHHGYVMGCKSGCEAFGSDEFCCRGHYNSPQTCKPSRYTDFFKKACPATFTFAHDSPSLIHECTSPNELKVIFCHA